MATNPTKGLSWWQMASVGLETPPTNEKQTRNAGPQMPMLRVAGAGVYLGGTEANAGKPVDPTPVSVDVSPARKHVAVDAAEIVNQ